MNQNSTNEEEPAVMDIIDFLDAYPDDFFDTIYPKPRVKSQCIYNPKTKKFTIPSPKSPVIKKFGANHSLVYHPMEIFYLISKDHVEMMKEKPDGNLEKMEYIDATGLALSLSPSNGHYNVFHELLKLGYKVNIIESRSFSSEEDSNIEKIMRDRNIVCTQDNEGDNKKLATKPEEKEEEEANSEKPLIYAKSFYTYDDVFNNTRRIFIETNEGPIDTAMPRPTVNFDVIYKVYYPSNKPTKKKPSIPDFMVICYRNLDDSCLDWDVAERVCKYYRPMKIIIALINGTGLPQYIHFNTSQTPIPSAKNFASIKCKIQF